LRAARIAKPRRALLTLISASRSRRIMLVRTPIRDLRTRESPPESDGLLVLGVLFRAAAHLVRRIAALIFLDFRGSGAEQIES